MATDYKEKARLARLKVLEMIHRGHTSHIASNFSVIDMATVLYSNLNEGDLVLWSKGWAAASIYYFLSEQGKIPKEDLDKFPNPPYIGLAEPTVPGVLAAGGAMGHGLPIACGIALAKKLSGNPGVVYCIMSDGEMNEGTTWECAMFAFHHKLDNLVVFVDKNKWQAMGKTEEVLNVNPAEAFHGFGWYVFERDGHDFNHLDMIFTDQNIGRYDGPRVYVLETIKGKGVSFFEDHLLYHYKHVDDDEYAKAVAELS